MHDEGPQEPVGLPLGERVSLKFGLLPSSDQAAWQIAADWVEDEGGSPVQAAAMRAGLWMPGPEVIDGSGSGAGAGYGSGAGDGDGDGDGSGDGYG